MYSHFAPISMYGHEQTFMVHFVSAIVYNITVLSLIGELIRKITPLFFPVSVCSATCYKRKHDRIQRMEGPPQNIATALVK